MIFFGILPAVVYWVGQKFPQPAHMLQRQADLCEFEASLVYKASSRTARAVTQRNPVLKIHK